MKIVISGVNLVEGGILSILTDCLSSFKQLKKKYDLDIWVLVHSKNLVTEFKDDFKFKEYPKTKNSWLKRLKFEFIYCQELSNQIKPDLWISLHDITPNVNCDFQVVYCHNPSSFYKLPINEGKYHTKEILFNKFYKYLYNINIKKNKYVIVQQNWLREEFERRYKVKTIVAYPQSDTVLNKEHMANKDLINPKYRFFYPSFSRVFKNFDILLSAIEILNKKRDDFELILTIDGTENRYSKFILNKFKNISNVKFMGKLTRKRVYNIYENCDCLVFPSKLETWGLPLSEFKLYDKAIICSDLPYAHETIGDYSKVKFFNPLNKNQLSDFMNDAIDGKLNFDKSQILDISQPFFSKWDDLLDFLLKEASFKI